MGKDDNIIISRQDIYLPTKLSKKILKTFLNLFFLSFLIFPSLLLSTTVPENLHFNVYRNNSKIGFHNLSFSNVDGQIESKIEIKFEVTFLGFVIYDYFHNNHEKWKDNSLVFMEANTNKNGDLLNCKLSKEYDSFKILGTKSDLILNKKITPTTYWKFNELIKGQKQKVLNTQDCSFINFEIEFLGNEMIYNNLLKASHYKLKGKEISGDDVNIDIWYKDKRWVKMIFLKDGSKIEYFLKEYDINEK